MQDRQLHRARIISSVAATLISLACGSNVRATAVCGTWPHASRSCGVRNVPSLTETSSTRVQYVYSAWAPQFADRLKYSTTQSNLVGLAGNLGMYACGLPIGMLVDKKGPRPAVLLGSIMLALGYFPLYQAYNSGSGSVALMCLYSFLTGLGGCTAFAAAIKTSALNWFVFFNDP